MKQINQSDVIKKLKKAGWQLMKQRGKGSHSVMCDPVTHKIVTIPRPKGKDLPAGTLAAIERQTGVKIRN